MNPRACLTIAVGAGLIGYAIGLSRAAEAGSAPQPAPPQKVLPATLPPRFVPPPVPAAQPAPGASVDDFLKWDAQSKSLTVSNGTAQAHYTFILTNTSKETVTITAATGSCFCTVARLPEQPWKIAPGATGELNVNMDTANRSGLLQKTVTVVTDKGVKILNVATTILPAVARAQMTAAERETNMKQAVADRQAVLTKAECVSCHAEPAKNKLGKDLYVSVCGVCHEGDHRNAMVPNLHTIAQETNQEFWKNWITHGKPGSLMPAFSQTEGGILTEEQITSLVNYLLSAIPSRPAAAASAPGPAPTVN